MSRTLIIWRFLAPITPTRKLIVLAICSQRSQMSEAMDIQRALFPEDAIAYANLQSYTGQLLARKAYGRTETRNLLEEALEVLEDEYGRNSPELIPTLLALGDSRGNAGSSARNNQLDYYHRALSIAERSDTDQIGVSAEVELHIGRQLASQGSSRRGLSYLESALERYEMRYGPNHPRTAQTVLAIGEAIAFLNDMNNARIYAERAIEIYSGMPAYTSNLIRARQLLMLTCSTIDDDENYTA